MPPYPMNPSVADPGGIKTRSGGHLRQDHKGPVFSCFDAPSTVNMWGGATRRVPTRLRYFMDSGPSPWFAR